MALPIALPLLLVAVLAVGGALAGSRDVTDPALPRSLPGDGAVSVRWTDPAQFSEIRHSGNRPAARRGDWVRRLAEHVQRRAASRLPAGERLEVVITDVRRAGDYEPWLGPSAHDIRVLREIYPPRITLDFTRYAADGSIIASGERRLLDPMYLSGVGGSSRSDPLRYEKQLIDRWIRRDLPPAGGS